MTLMQTAWNRGRWFSATGRRGWIPGLLALLLIAGAWVGAAPARAVPMTIDYSDTAGVGFNDPVLGAKRKAAFQAAVNDWSQRLGGSIPISIRAFWVSFSPNAVLASGQPAFLTTQFANSPHPTSFYPIALANEIAGMDLTAGMSDHHEVVIRFNTDVDTPLFAQKFGGNYYYGLDGNCGRNIDFFSTCMHELTHALGFSGLFLPDGSFDGLFPAAYDMFLANGPSPTATLLTAQTPAARAAEEIGGSLYFAGPASRAANGGTNVKLYAPATFTPGSTTYHLDQATYFNRSPLLVPSTVGGLPIHDPGPIIMGMLRDMGWNINPAAAVGPGASFQNIGGNLDPVNGGTFPRLDSTHPVVITADGSARSVLFYIRRNSDLKSDAAASADPANVVQWWNPSSQQWQALKTGFTYLAPANNTAPVTAAFSTSLPSGASLPPGVYTFDAESYNAGGFVSTSIVSIVNNVTGLWQGIDVAVGSDSRARLLWGSPTFQLKLTSVANTGASTPGGAYGPYASYAPVAVAAGGDGLTRVLWNRSDGSLSLWLVDASNTYKTSVNFGPFAGFMAVDVSVGADNQARLLWKTPGGSFVVWSVAASGAYGASSPLGPVVGYTPARVAAGADGLTRVLLTGTDNMAMIALLTADNKFAGLYSLTGALGWSATDVTVGSDNLTRVLWTSPLGAAQVWSVTNAGVPRAGPVYGPLAGWTPQALAAGADGLTRLIWRKTDGTEALWLLSAANVQQSGFAYPSP